MIVLFVLKKINIKYNNVTDVKKKYVWRVSGN